MYFVFFLFFFYYVFFMFDCLCVVMFDSEVWVGVVCWGGGSWVSGRGFFFHFIFLFCNFPLEGEHFIIIFCNKVCALEGGGYLFYFF